MAEHHKICELCGSEFVAIRRDTRFCCKKCKNSAYHRTYREANRDDLLAYGRSYREANREKIRVNYEARRSERLAYAKAYWRANRDKLLAKKRDYRENNRKKTLEYWETNREELISKKRERHRKKAIASHMQDAIMAIPEIEKLIEKENSK